MNLIRKVRQALEIKFNSLQSNSKLKNNVLNALPFWIGAFITGLTSVLYANLFSRLESLTTYIYNFYKWAFFIITPLCFLTALWLVVRFAEYAKGSGIPQVTAAIDLTNPKHAYKVNKLLSFRILVTKVLSSFVMVLGGGAIGREGPTIQISATIFKKINDLLPNWYPKISRRNMIVTGAAAGLASAFNTPLGGIVFAIEELTKIHFSFFKSALLTGVIIAGLTALHFLGPYLYLGYPALDGIPDWITLAIIPVAVITGLAGSGMGRIIRFIFKKKDAFKKKRQQYVFVIVCGLILSSLAIFVDHRCFGSGKEIMVTTLFTDEKQLTWSVPILRFIGPILSFSTGAAGGIFAPSLSAGASIGAIFAEWFNLSAPATNLLILCGMTGFLTGITKSPFTCSILILEMTNSHNIIFDIMLAALLATLVANLLSRHSFYDHLKDRYIREIHQQEVQDQQAANQKQQEENHAGVSD